MPKHASPHGKTLVHIHRQGNVGHQIRMRRRNTTRAGTKGNTMSLKARVPLKQDRAKKTIVGGKPNIASPDCIPYASGDLMMSYTQFGGTIQ